MMNRREYLKAAGLGLAALAVPGCMGVPQRLTGKRPPNIVLIVSDDQGYRDLGCSGSPDIKTPNLDRPRPGVQAPLEYLRARYGAYDPKDADTARARRMRYMAATTYMDEAIGQILETLATHGLQDNTIVIFFSDNGGSGGADNAPLKGGKGQMFEGGLRVPCIVRWPGVVPAGSVCDEFLSSMEVFPMLCSAAGVRPPRGVMLDGFDMTTVLAGGQKSLRNEMCWQRRGDKAARVGSYKWIESARGSGLFDLSSDIGERHNLSKEKPDVLAMVKTRFEAWEEQMAQAEPRGPFRDF